YQTLDFKGGDSDDLAVLFAAVLESVGIHTAYLPLDDDVILAFSLSDAGGSASSFTFPEDFVFQYGKTWVPVRVSFIREGFMNAWLKGSETMREAAASGAEIALIPVEDAWKAYPSIGVPGVEAKLVKPPDEQVGKAFENVISHFIAREIGPRVQELLSGMEQDGGSGRDHNRLGLLYARYSLLKEARSEFETAVSKGVQLAYVNLGNVAYLQKDFESAVNFFQKALEFQPANKAALVGLARAKYELDLFADADELYSQIRESDPVLAERYSYLSSRLDTGGARASSVGERDKNIFWSEDE
ncbi:MAG: tetratricopeptide repeat protein, partial [Spirochaetales bacterium]